MRASLPSSLPPETFLIVIDFQLEVLEDFIRYLS